MVKVRPLAFAAGAVVLLVVSGLLMSGTLAPSATLDVWAPWVGFGGAFLLFILAVRSRKS